MYNTTTMLSTNEPLHSFYRKLRETTLGDVYELRETTLANEKDRAYYIWVYSFGLVQFKIFNISQLHIVGMRQLCINHIKVINNLQDQHFGDSIMGYITLSIGHEWS